MNIMITGAAGFIGSCLVTELNRRGFTQLFLVDNFYKPDKDVYLSGKSFAGKIDSPHVFEWLAAGEVKIDFVFHLGGKTANKTDFRDANVVFSQDLFRYCDQHGIPFVYASSSYTYGAGEFGYVDHEALISKLNPLNDYAKSKHEFDLWMLHRKSATPWAGLKIFNVFGPNEYHKGLSTSVAFKSFFEIRNTGKVMLFDSSVPGYGPGDQLRDFIYVKDVVRVFCWFLKRWMQSPGQFPSGIYNLGTGTGRSFNDVARAVFSAMDLPERIEYKPIPEKILKSYPERTVAVMDKLMQAGYDEGMHSLETGMDDLVRNYLSKGNYG